jgi:hypothetical protein
MVRTFSSDAGDGGGTFVDLCLMVLGATAGACGGNVLTLGSHNLWLGKTFASG